jgi:hypothetical protein
MACMSLFITVLEIHAARFNTSASFDDLHEAVALEIVVNCGDKGGYKAKITQQKVIYYTYSRGWTERWD